MNKFDFNSIDFTKVVQRLKTEKEKYDKKDWIKMREEAGIIIQTESNIFGSTEQKPSIEYIARFASITGKPVEYFLYGDDYFLETGRSDLMEIKRIKDYLNPDFKYIYETSVKTCYYSFRWLKMFADDPFSLVCMKVHGDSMNPILMNGDHVQIDLSKKHPTDGSIFAFHYKDNTQIILRKFTFEANKIELIADNPQYTKNFVKSEDIFIIGQVVMSKRIFVMVSDNL